MPQHPRKFPAALVRAGARVGLALVALSIVVPAAHADNWAPYKKQCDKTAFKSPSDVDMAVLGRCVRLFGAHHGVDKLHSAYKSRVVAAMQRLYTEGTDIDAHMARLGLQRLGVQVPPRPRRDGPAVATTTKASAGQPAAATAPKTKPKFSTCPGGTEPDPPDKRAIKKAKKLLKKGLKRYRKKDYEGALAIFEKMLKVAPGYHGSLYNVAAMEAMTGDPDGAYDMLECLRDIGTEDHLRKLKDARKDEDFFSLRDDDRFKRLTGYAKILLLDSLPEGRGEDNVDNLKGSIEKLGYPVFAVKQDNREKTEPHIWYRWTNKVQAFLFKKLIDHPRTKIQLMPPQLEERGYDIIISWGDRYEKDKEPTLRIPDPDEADKSLDELARTEDEIIRSPDKYTKKVDEAVNAPDKAMGRVDKTAGKVEKVLDAPGKAVDKVKEVGDKLKSPFK